ncbi:MAG: glycosyltransferase [Gemmatimonadaceae bacterium]|jgi:sterol 3beta-glucosyltransferase|nr:glycosyltransferase [Gemmatimonadaceae bacterium]
MHLVIVTAGSRGDVQPYLALAVAAQQAGLRVTLATHATFADWIASHGIAFRALHGDPRAVLADPGARAWTADGSWHGLLRFAGQLRRDFAGLLRGILDDLVTATADADIVCWSAVCQAAAMLHEARGLPVIGGLLQPLTPTREFSAVGIPWQPGDTPARRRKNVRSHVIGELLLWLPSRRHVNRWRRDALALPPVAWRGPYAAQRNPDYPLLYAYGAAALPKPPDWPAWIDVTGWWTLPAPADWTPPPALARFLADGAPPLCVSFGSMTPADGAPLGRMLVEAATRAGTRLLLLQGWGDLTDDGAPLPAHVHVERDVPHDWLFPRCAAVLHHGGSGTTGAAARAGVPTIIAPLGFDQSFWAVLMQARGASVATLPRRALTAEVLAPAITRALTDGAARESAARLGEALRAEPGTALAVERIVAHARRG